MVQIEDFIPVGYDKRVSRRELQLMTGLSDRTIRQLIEASKEPIISCGKGYFIPDPENITDRLALKEYYMQERSRMIAIRIKLSKYNSLFESIEGQESMVKA